MSANQFAAYATGAAFRIDLTKRMIGALFQLANGGHLDTGHYGAHGLVARGLAEKAEVQPRNYVTYLAITEAGRKVADLCVMAGLGEITSQDGQP